MERAVSVVIPIHNEEELLEKNVHKLESFLEKHKIKYEILLVENGSTDRTLEIAKQLSKKNHRVRWFHMKTPQYSGALRFGLMKSKYNPQTHHLDFAMGLDFIPQALNVLPNADIVAGSRYMGNTVKDRRGIRTLLSRCYNLLLSLAFRTNYTDFDGIKLYRRDIARAIANKTKECVNFYDAEALVLAKRSGLRVIEIPVPHIEHRKSRFNILKLTMRSFRDIALNYKRMNSKNYHL